MKDHWVIMSNDFPDCIAIGSEAFANATAKARKEAYLNRNKHNPGLEDRMYFRARKVEVFKEGKVE